MVLFRRFVVLAALLFWQGGGAFYSAVALRIGRRVLREQIDLQSFITRDVTFALNWVGVAALCLLALDLKAADPSRTRRWLRVIGWIVLGVCQVALFALHARLSAVYDDDVVAIADRSTFRVDHHLYLWTSTLQFAVAVAFLFASLAAWRAADGCRGAYRDDPGATIKPESDATVRLES